MRSVFGHVAFRGGELAIINVGKWGEREGGKTNTSPKNGGKIREWQGKTKKSISRHQGREFKGGKPGNKQQTENSLLEQQERKTDFPYFYIFRKDLKRRKSRPRLVLRV